MSEWVERAERAWSVLAETSLTRTPRGLRVHEPGRRRVVDSWTISQLLRTAVTLEWAGGKPGRMDADAAWRSVARYRRGPGVVDLPFVGKRYYDDNAWLGLACALRAVAGADPNVSQIWWRRAEDQMRFVSRGFVRGGGVHLVEGSSAVHAGATGAAAALAAALGSAPRGIGRRWNPIAVRSADFLAGALTADGLIVDSLEPDGTADPTVFAHNQGLAIEVLLWNRQTERAQSLALACMRHFDSDRLWRSPCALNVILCRALLKMSASGQAPQGAPMHEYVDEYLDRLWYSGRDSRGLFVKMGRYGGRTVLDHVAAIDLMASRALPARDAALLW